MLLSELEWCAEPQTNVWRAVVQAGKAVVLSVYWHDYPGCVFYNIEVTGYRTKAARDAADAGHPASPGWAVHLDLGPLEAQAVLYHYLGENKS